MTARKEVPAYEFYPPHLPGKTYADEEDMVPPYNKLRRPNRKSKQARNAGKANVLASLTSLPTEVLLLGVLTLWMLVLAGY